MAEIVIRNLRKEFGAFTAVKGSSFTIKDGEFFMLLGPSGCGRTTTLRMIAGLELPTSGEILIDGEDVSQKPASQRDIAMVFQMFALYPHMNVHKNIAYPLVSQGAPEAEVQKKVAEVARILRIDHMLDKPVDGLSGGDRQRVALGPHQIVTLSDTHTPLRPGDSLPIRPQNPLWFDASGNQTQG